MVLGRWAKLSVRGLMVLVLIAAAGLAHVTNQARTQQAAVAAIEKAGGEVYYDWERPVNALTTGLAWASPKQARSHADPPWPKWFVRAVGIDYFGSADHVEFGPYRQRRPM